MLQPQSKMDLEFNVDMQSLEKEQQQRGGGKE